MKSLKLPALAVALCGFASIAGGSLVISPNVIVPDDNPATVLNLFKEMSQFSGAHTCLDRLNGPFASGATLSLHTFELADLTFNFSSPQNFSTAQAAHVSFSFFSGSTEFLAGIFVFGGSIDGQLTGNLYIISPDQGQPTGSLNVTGPDLPFSVNQATIQNIDVFCAPVAANTPDSGATAMLLASVLGGLGTMRRYLRP
jgi:hypothetical protein